MLFLRPRAAAAKRLLGPLPVRAPRNIPPSRNSIKHLITYVLFPSLFSRYGVVVDIYLRYGVSHFSDVVALYFVLGLVLISIKKNENSPDKKKAGACVL